MSAAPVWDGTDAAVTAGLLEAAGLGSNVGPKAQLFARAVAALRADGTTAPVRGWFVPGRIEVLGKHTDYCGGRSLVAAVERGICIVAAPRTDGEVRIQALDVNDAVRFRWDPELSVPHGDWRNYPMTVARRLARNFPDTCTRGADIAFGSDLPLASGMSSSSALVVATYLALADIEGVEQTEAFRAAVDGNLARAEYLGTHENGQTYGALTGDRGVGTFGGSEDHTAILCSQAGMLGQFRYCPTRLEGRAPLPSDWCFALGVSGVVAEKTGAAQVLYNRASLRSRALVEAWRAAGHGDQVYLAEVLSSAPDAGQRLRQAIAHGHGDFGALELSMRLEHFEKEDGLIDAASQALRDDDVAAFGELVDHSQTWTESLLGNQVPETVALAQQARALGAAAASAFGAGFGGCVWALVRRDEVDDFVGDWGSAYARAFAEHRDSAHFFASGAGPAAFRIASD